MPIGVKKVARNDGLTLWEKLYIPEIVSGMAVTLRHFAVNITGSVLELFGGPKYRKVMTMYYPEESPTPPPTYRGRPVLVVGANGLEKCVACGLCEVACPAHCISIIGAERNEFERYPLSYTLDGSRCIFCGLCEEACPKEAIVMSDEWQNLCEYDRTKMIYSKEDLFRHERTLTKRLTVIRNSYFGKSRYKA